MPVVSTANIGRRSDGTFEEYVPPGVVDAGGGLDPQAPPGAAGEILLESSAPASFDSSLGYDLVVSTLLPAGSWRVFGGVSGVGLSGFDFSLGLHLNFGDGFAQALASGRSTDGATKTTVATLAGGLLVYLKAQTDAPFSSPVFSIIAQRIS